MFGGNAPEANVIRTVHSETMLDMPWNNQTVENPDLTNAQEMLEQKNHYGLEKCKERVLEFLAVRNYVTEAKGTSSHYLSYRTSGNRNKHL